MFSQLGELTGQSSFQEVIRIHFHPFRRDGRSDAPGAQDRVVPPTDVRSYG